MDIQSKLSSKLSNLKDKAGNKVELSNLEDVVADLLTLFIEQLKSSDEGLYNDVIGIESKIREAKKEISDSMNSSDTVVGGAALELDAVIKQTEEATDKILDAAERVQGAVAGCSDSALAEKVTSDITIIFEACNFQDLTGQRIKKVTSALEFIEESVGHILDKYSFDDVKKDSRADAKLMDGPQNINDLPDQGDVDKLFDSL